MKKHDLPEELVEKTVETLDEVEDAVLGTKTGVKAGHTFCNAGACPAPPYGTGID